MEWPVDPTISLGGLFIASFLAATLLPGGSEVVFAALLASQPQQAGIALALATLGNTLGGMSTYAMARLLPATPAADTSGRSLPYAKLGAGEAALQRRHLALLQRWGPLALLLAWLPVIGDALCAAAGWLRMPWLYCMVWMAVGKGARYLVIAWGMNTLGTLIP